MNVVNCVSERPERMRRVIRAAVVIVVAVRPHVQRLACRQYLARGAVLPVTIWRQKTVVRASRRRGNESSDAGFGRGRAFVCVEICVRVGRGVGFGDGNGT